MLVLVGQACLSRRGSVVDGAKQLMPEKRQMAMRLSQLKSASRPGQRLRRLVSRLGRSGTMPPRPSSLAPVRPETRSRAYRATIRRSPNTETAQPRSSLTSTHILGLEGDALRMVAEAALKAKVDTNLFGDVASQLGLDAQGAAGFLDQLTVASQGSGR